MYVGSTSGLLMCGSDRSVYVGGWVSVCVFTCRSLCVCVWGCVYVEQRYGASEVIWVLVKAPPPQRSFALHLPGFVFLTLSCSSDPFTLCWCLSLAHCCMTVSHQHSPQRAECVPTNGGVKAICECLLKSSSSCILFLLFMNLCVCVGGCVCGGGQRQPVFCNLLKHKTGEILVLEETAPSSTTSLCQVIHIYNLRIWAM